MAEAATSPRPILAVTGHRPEKLGGYSQDARTRLFEFACSILPRHNPRYVITGMALGWDQAIAEACIALKIPFVAAVPFPSQPSRWPPSSREHYDYLLRHASVVKNVYPDPYAAWKMQQRNVWMVEACGALLALWNGSAGGTGNCVAYARTIQRPWINVWADWERMPRE